MHNNKLYEHFRMKGHSHRNMRILVLEEVFGDENIVKAREEHWIQRCNTVQNGLNSNRKCIDITYANSNLNFFSGVDLFLRPSFPHSWGAGPGVRVGYSALFPSALIGQCGVRRAVPLGALISQCGVSSALQI